MHSDADLSMSNDIGLTPCWPGNSAASFCSGRAGNRGRELASAGRCWPPRDGRHPPGRVADRLRLRQIPFPETPLTPVTLPMERETYSDVNLSYAEDHMGQRGLDARHRDKDGRIAKKHGNTMISTLRRTYPGFAPNEQGTAKLSHVLDRLDETSLSKLVAEEE